MLHIGCAFKQQNSIHSLASQQYSQKMSNSLMNFNIVLEYSALFISTRTKRVFLNVKCQTETCDQEKQAALVRSSTN